MNISSLAVACGTASYVPVAADRLSGVPAERVSAFAREHLQVFSSSSCDVGAAVLAALGVADEPLFLVRSGPQRDTMVAELARLVHDSGWPGEDVGITHLDELGGTVVFDLLSWAVPSSATVVICDEPLFADSRAVPGFSAVGLRVSQSSGGLRVLSCGEGAPSFSGLTFSGSGPCDAWLALHSALCAGSVRAGAELMLHARGPFREGWVLLGVGDVEGLVSVAAG